jgi:hypothetical protein
MPADLKMKNSSFEIAEKLLLFPFPSQSRKKFGAKRKFKCAPKRFHPFPQILHSPHFPIKQRKGQAMSPEQANVFSPFCSAAADISSHFPSPTASIHPTFDPAMLIQGPFTAISLFAALPVPLYRVLPFPSSQMQMWWTMLWARTVHMICSPSPLFTPSPAQRLR